MKTDSARPGRCLAILIACVSPASSAESDAAPAREMTRARQAAVFTAYFENDTLGNTDRHYTAGTKFSWLSSDYSHWREREGMVNRVGERLPLVNEPGTQKNIGFAIGQNIYTPQR